MFPFTRIGPFDRTEKKALLLAFLFCALFIVSFSLSMSANRTRKKRVTLLSTTPLITPLEPSVPSYVDPLEKFRLVPENFWKYDFRNFSYGVYATSNGRMRALTLTHGVLEDDSGWFELKDVYYKDITGEGSEEAIVRLSRVRCSGSCDGGGDIFFVYTTRNGKLKNLWRYETGSYAYGCGLKSFTLGSKQIDLELFGRCPRPAMEYPGPAKFVVDDLTLVLFEFDGRRFTTTTIDYIPESARNVKNWEPEIRIY